MGGTVTHCARNGGVHNAGVRHEAYVRCSTNQSVAIAYVHPVSGCTLISMLERYARIGRTAYVYLVTYASVMYATVTCTMGYRTTHSSIPLLLLPSKSSPSSSSLPPSSSSLPPPPPPPPLPLLHLLFLLLLLLLQMAVGNAEPRLF